MLRIIQLEHWSFSSRPPSNYVSHITHARVQVRRQGSSSRRNRYIIKQIISLAGRQLYQSRAIIFQDDALFCISIRQNKVKKALGKQYRRPPPPSSSRHALVEGQFEDFTTLALMNFANTRSWGTEHATTGVLKLESRHTVELVVHEKRQRTCMPTMFSNRGLTNDQAA